MHNRGVIDTNYVTHVGDQLAIGERLVLSAADVEQGLLAVNKAMVEILSVAKQLYERN